MITREEYFQFTLQKQGEGKHTLELNNPDFSTGLYLIRLNVNGQTSILKAVKTE